VQKIDFEIRPDLGCTNLKTSRKVVLDNPSVCLSVSPSVCLTVVCLAVAFPASSHRRSGVATGGLGGARAPPTQILAPVGIAQNRGDTNIYMGGSLGSDIFDCRLCNVTTL